MHDPMADADNFPAGLCGSEPFKQIIKGLVVADLLAIQKLVGDALTGFVLGNQLGRMGTDSVNLAGNFGIW